MVIKLFSKTVVKKLVFSLTTSVIILAVLNLVASFISPRHSVFWDNPLMVMYPVDHFDQDITMRQHNLNNATAVHYVPDETRWYRLNPEPEIPTDGRLILNFGDSSTWGWGLSDRNDAYPEVLNEFILNARSINLGVPGYSSLQGRRYFEEMMSRYATRVAGATLYFGNNDSTENGAPDAAKVSAEAKRAQVALRHLAIYRLLREVLSQPRTNQLPRVSSDEYSANMMAMVEMANRFGIPIVVIKPPVNLSWPPGHLNYTLNLEPQVRNQWTRDELEIAKEFWHNGIDQISHQDDNYEAQLEKAVEHDWVMPRIKHNWLVELSKMGDRGIPVVETQAVFIEAGFPYIFEDYCHPTARVHREIATKVATSFGFI